MLTFVGRNEAWKRQHVCCFQPDADAYGRDIYRGDIYHISERMRTGALHLCKLKCK